MNKTRVAKLSLMQLTLFIIVSVDTIRNLPAAALFGSSLIFFYLLAGLFFLIPVGLASAELSARFKHPGGVYIWAREAFGRNWGFMAVWLQWVENVVWYPTILSTVAGMIGYLISPDFANKPAYLFCMVISIFWLLTWLNSRGIQTSARFSTFCTVAGLFLPMAIIIGLGVTWVINGHPVAIQLDWHHIIPHGDNSHLWVALTGIILSLCGMELATVHCTDVVNPGKNFPRALFYSTIIILTTLILGSLAIAIILPQDTINLVTGIMQAFSAFLSAYDIGYLLPVFGIMMVLGGLGTISNWLITPVRSFLLAAEDDNLPRHFATTNSRGVPNRMLIYQALLVTTIASIFLLLPHTNTAYWLLTVSSSQVYMLMYMLMFVVFMVHHLRDTNGATVEFRIPGGRPVAWLVTIVGFFGSLVPLLIGFIPPQEVADYHITHYSLWVLAVLAVYVLPPFILLARRNAKANRK